MAKRGGLNINDPRGTLSVSEAYEHHLTGKLPARRHPTEEATESWQESVREWDPEEVKEWAPEDDVPLKKTRRGGNGGFSLRWLRPPSWEL